MVQLEAQTDPLNADGASARQAVTSPAMGPDEDRLSNSPLPTLLTPKNVATRCRVVFRKQIAAEAISAHAAAMSPRVLLHGEVNGELLLAGMLEIIPWVTKAPEGKRPGSLALPQVQGALRDIESAYPEAAALRRYLFGGTPIAQIASEAGLSVASIYSRIETAARRLWTFSAADAQPEGTSAAATLSKADSQFNGALRGLIISLAAFTKKLTAAERAPAPLSVVDQSPGDVVISRLENRGVLRSFERAEALGRLFRLERELGRTLTRMEMAQGLIYLYGRSSAPPSVLRELPYIREKSRYLDGLEKRSTTDWNLCKRLAQKIGQVIHSDSETEDGMAERFANILASYLPSDGPRTGYILHKIQRLLDLELAERAKR